jgi:HEAT repeat protein
MYKCRTIAGVLFLTLGVAVHAEDRPTVPAVLANLQGVTDLEGKSLSYWITEIKSSDPGRRERAISALPHFGSAACTPEVVGKLLERFKPNIEKDASPRLRALQVLNLLEVKDNDVKRVVEGLTDSLKDAHSPIRYNAALGLVRFGPEARAAIPLLATKIAEDKFCWEIRRAGLAALIAAGRDPNGGPPDPMAVEAMLKASKDVKASEVRMEAAIGMGALGKNTDAKLADKVESALNNLVSDEDERVSVSAKFSLLTLHGHKDAAIVDFAGFFGHPKVTVRSHALRALSLLGPKGKPAQTQVIEVLNDKDPSVQIAAITALVSMEDKGEVVLKALKDLTERMDALEGVRQTAQLAMDVLQKKMIVKPNVPPPQPPNAAQAPAQLEGKTVKDWVDDLKHQDASIRERALNAIPVFGKAVTGGMALEALLKEVQNPNDASPRLRALEVVNRMDIKPAEAHLVVKALATRLWSVNEKQALVRFEAAQGLIRFGEDAHWAIPGLLEVAHDDTSWELRRAGVAALVAAGRTSKGPDSRAVACLVQLQHDVSSDVKLEVALGLGALGRTTNSQLAGDVGVALKHLVNDKDIRVSIWARVSQMALAGHDDKYAKTISDLIRSPEVQVRVNALRAIAAMGPKGKFAQDRVLDALADKEPSVAIAAMGALVSMDDRGAPIMIALKQLAESKDGPEGVRQAAQNAQDALRRIKK